MYYVGPSLAASETPFKWRFACGPIMTRFWWYLEPLSFKNKLIITFAELDPLFSNETGLLSTQNMLKLMIEKILTTRTHSMARHRKYPRSRRDQMVIDPVTPSQGHQFDCRVIFFSVSWATVLPLYFDIPHDLFQKITFLTPSTPKSQTLGHGPGDLIKSRLICFISIICEKTHTVWF